MQKKKLKIEEESNLSVCVCVICGSYLSIFVVDVVVVVVGFFNNSQKYLI